MEVFKTQIRRVGSSFGVLVPKRVVAELQAREGDTVEIAVLPSAEERRRLLDALLGSVPALPPFQRERRDRF